MKCKNCKNEIEPGSVFCGKCGTTVKKGNRAPLYIVIVAAVILVVTAAMVIALNKGNEKSDAKTGDKTTSVTVDKDKKAKEPSSENKETPVKENDEKQEEKITEKEEYNDGFYKAGHSFVLLNGKIIGAGKDGVCVIDAKKYESEISFEEGFDPIFVTDGSKIYATKDSNKLYEVDLKKKEAKKLYEKNFESEYSGLGVIGKGGEYVYVKEESEGSDYKVMYYNLKTEEYGSFKSVNSPEEIYYSDGKIYYVPSENALVLSSIYESSPDGSNEVKIMEDVAAGTAFFHGGNFYCVKVTDKEAYGNKPQYGAQIISFDVKTKETKTIESTEISTDSSSVGITDFGYAYGFYNDAAGETECCVMYNNGKRDGYFGNIVMSDKEFLIIETDMNGGENVAVEYYIYTEDGGAKPVKASVYKNIVGYSNGRLYCREYVSEEDIYKLETIDVEF